MLTERAPKVSAMTTADIPDGMALVAEAGWNQVEDDWRLMLAIGRCMSVRDDTDRVIATCLTLDYQHIGWIAMVLVASAHRRQGLARALLNDAIAHIAGEQRVAMLDATPAGREVYLRLGFEDGPQIQRWRGNGRGTGHIERDAVDLQTLVQSDAAAFGAPRRELLVEVHARPSAFVLSADDGAYALTRAGRTATQVGPIFATSPEAAMAICGRAIETLTGPLIIDVPLQETALVQFLSQSGFIVERPFIRMARGGRAVIGETMRATAGPELG